MLEIARTQAQQSGVPQVPLQEQAAVDRRHHHRVVRLGLRLAQFRRTKDAVKLHLMLDHDGLLPCFGVITDGKQHEVTVTRQWEFAPGAILVFDRGYTDYNWPSLELDSSTSRQGLQHTTLRPYRSPS
jgi:hypothetical protein